MKSLYGNYDWWCIGYDVCHSGGIPHRRSECNKYHVNVRYIDSSLVLNYTRLLRTDMPEHESAIEIISNYYNIPSEQSPAAHVLASRLALQIFCDRSIQYTGWYVTDTSDEIVVAASNNSELLPILLYNPSVDPIPHVDLRNRAEQLILEYDVQPGSVLIILNPKKCTGSDNPCQREGGKEPHMVSQ
jgi:hypothetical protein